MDELNSNQTVCYRVEITTACNNNTLYELKGNNLLECCPECEQSLHTKSQVKACKKQNQSLVFRGIWDNEQFSVFEKIWMTLLH